jgi:hypothetical protein
LPAEVASRATNEKAMKLPAAISARANPSIVVHRVASERGARS